MYAINQITDDALQTQNLVLPSGDGIQFTLQFMPQQYGWFLTNFVYTPVNGGTVRTYQGLRVVNSPNMLHQWKNLLPFGLACYSIADREPSLQQDFLLGNSTLYILTAAEVAAYEAFLG